MFYKHLLSSVLLITSSAVLADMPYISNSTTESYERVTSNDITCESRKAHSTLNAGYYQSEENELYSFNNQNKDKGVYVAISIPLTSNKSQVSCQGLYNSALRKEQLRVEQLEQQLSNYKSRQLSLE